MGDKNDNRIKTRKEVRQMDISIVFEDNIYKVKLSGELTYNHSSIGKVEEMFGVDMASYFADAIREACRNNAIIKRNMKEPRIANLECPF